jgi:hypothetical protein
LKNACENESNFYLLWKQYLEKTGGTKDSPDVAKELTDQVNGVMGDDGDDEAVAAEPAAASQSEGGSGSEGGGAA